KKGGELLSNKYLNTTSHLRWKCSNGHIWKAKPANIKSGKWCAKCFGNVKHTITYINDKAKARGGVCLSKNYINAKSIITWKCGNVQIWEAIFVSVIKNS